MRALLLPSLVFAVCASLWLNIDWIAHRLLGAPAAAALETGVATLTWLAGALTTVRIVDLAAKLSFQHRTGHPPPSLLTDLLAAAIWLAAIATLAVFVYGVSPSAALTTSGMVVAVIGFAVRSMIADLFYGVTLAIERPFEIGHWIRLRDGVIGRVVEMSWRAVKLITHDNLSVVVPNSQIATEYVVNYDEPEPSFRSSLRITLGYDATAEQVARLLLSAVRQVPETAEIAHRPDALVVDYLEHGVVWELRFWIPHYEAKAEVSQRVHEALLRNLRFAGVRVPRPQEEVLLGRIDAERRTAKMDAEGWIHRLELFEPVPLDARATLQSRARPLQLAAGEDVVRRGEPGASLFVVREGAFDVWLEEGGAETPVGHLGPGAVFGEMSLLTGAPRSATIRAATSARVYEITKDDLAPLLHSHPELARQFADQLARHRRADAQRDAARDSAGAVPEQERPIAALLESVRSFFKLPSPASADPPSRPAAPLS